MFAVVCPEFLRGGSGLFAVEPEPEGLAAKGRKEGRKKGGDGGDEGMGMGKTDFALQRLVLRMFEKRG